MRISVIIPAYNSAKYLPETIESVLSQAVSDWELIIVNDGSKDSTLEVAQQYADRDSRIRVLNKQNGGVSAARNTGCASTCPESEYMCYLDADDIWESDTLQAFMEALDAQPAAVAVHGLPCAIDAESRFIRQGELEAHFRDRWAVVDKRLIKWPLDRPTTFACEVVSNYVQTSGAIMVRRSVQEKSGGFDERMGGCADWDMWLRLCRSGDIIFLNRVVLRYRHHGNNMSGQNKLMADDETFLRRKLLSWPEETPERRELARWGYRHRLLQVSGYRMIWALGALRAGNPIQTLQQLRHAVRGLAKCAGTFG